jgi:hypothetical protein
MRHRGHGTGAQREGLRRDRPAAGYFATLCFLLHNTKHWMPPLDGPSVDPVRSVDAHDLLAQHPEFGIANPVELHAQVENGDRQQLGGISPAALAKRGPAFLEGLKNIEHVFV